MDAVTIRDVRSSDLPIFFEQQLDPDAVRMAVFFSRNREAFDAHWKKILTNPDCVVQTIEHNGEVAGNLGTWADGDHRLLGYWLGKSFWGKGIATRALMRFLEFDPRPLQAHVAKSNVASIRVLEKCGFRMIGEDAPPPFEPGGEPVEEWIFERKPLGN